MHKAVSGQSRCLINASYYYSVKHHPVCQQDQQNSGELTQVLYIMVLMRKSSAFTLWLWNVCVLAKTRKKVLKGRWEERGFHIRRETRWASGLEKWRLRCTVKNFMEDRNSMNNNLFMKYWKIRTGVEEEYFEVSTWTDGYLTVPAHWVLQFWSSLAQEVQSNLHEGYV